MRYFVTVGPRCVLLSAEAKGWSRTHLFWRVGGALLLAVPLAAVLLGVLAAPANATQIKVHCEVYATNHVDPIAFSDHLHHQIGNTSTTNKSTANSLLNNRSTSCDEGWFTTAGWFPVERYESVSGVNVYYRAPGDQTKIANVPKGLQLLGTREEYVCNGEGSGSGLQDTPVYGCNRSWSTRVIFPWCWNGFSLDERATVYGPTNGTCPASHPIRLPQINYLVMHKNTDGRVPNPLQVSAGIDEWQNYTFMHADYFAANQPVFNNELLDLCLRDAPDRVLFASPRCGEGP
jgi:Domain of unknown function (DUF1996)